MYKRQAIYSGDELLPRQVELQYVGIDSSGNLLEIKLGGDKETLDSQGVTHVILDNQSPNAEINYADGTATNTVTEFTEAPSEPSSESSQVTEQPSSCLLYTSVIKMKEIKSQDYIKQLIVYW